MRRILTSVLLLALSAVAVHARQQQPATGGARLIDQFGEIRISDLKARLDLFAAVLPKPSPSPRVVRRRRR